MQLTTPDALINHFVPDGFWNQGYLDLAVEQMLKDRWVISYHPDIEWPFRPIAQTQPFEHLAPIISSAYEASRTVHSPVIELPRGMVETRAGHLIGNPECGARLARRGLIIVACSETTINLRGFDPAVALLVNASRYGTKSRGQLATSIVKAALGKQMRPKELSESNLFESQQILNRFGVSMDEVRPNSTWIKLRSDWQIPNARQFMSWGGRR
ncbi:hypothetical protein OT109_09320 [Phycisphaeraceae bacterium D3-23]